MIIFLYFSAFFASIEQLNTNFLYFFKYSIGLLQFFGPYFTRHCLLLFAFTIIVLIFPQLPLTGNEKTPCKGKQLATSFGVFIFISSLEIFKRKFSKEFHFSTFYSLHVQRFRIFESIMQKGNFQFSERKISAI